VNDLLISARKSRKELAVPSLAARLSGVLEDLILSGRAKPGSRIIEEDLAREFGISRSSLREAIVGLEQAGYITRDGRKTGRVIRPLSSEDARERYQLYAILESEAAAAACVHATAADIDRLEALLDRMRATSKEKDYQLLNLEFHTQLARPCPNRALLEAYGNALKQVRWAWALGVITLGESSDSRNEHARVVEAYRTRDAARVLSMHRAHIEAGFQRLVTQSLEKTSKRTRAATAAS
jgi:DNA-binding GntR family transcriptional regulator